MLDNLFKRRDEHICDHTVFENVEQPWEGQFYLIRKTWLDRWRAYLKGSNLSRPGPIDNSSLNCSCGAGVLVSDRIQKVVDFVGPSVIDGSAASVDGAHTFGEGAPDAEIVSQFEWETLVKNHNVKPVTASNGGGDSNGPITIDDDGAGGASNTINLSGGDDNTGMDAGAAGDREAQAVCFTRGVGGMVEWKPHKCDKCLNEAKSAILEK